MQAISVTSSWLYIESSWNDRFKKMMSEKKGEANPVGENNIRYAETLLRQVEINVNDEENTLEKIRNNLVSLFGAVPSSDRIWGDEQFKVFENKMVAQKETELLLQLASKGERSEELTTNSKEIEESRRNLQRYLVNLVQISYAEIFKDYHPLIVEYFYQLTTLESYKQKRKSLIAYIDAVKTNRALYNSFLKAKTSTQITESVQNTDLGVSIEVVEDAAKPLSPVRPNKPKIIIIAVLFGGVLGVGSLVVSEYSDTSFKTVEEVEQKLGLTVLGTIPRSDPSKGWKSADRRKKIIAWTAASIIVIVISLLGFYYYGKSEGKHGLELYRTSQTK
jgi:hypothetical protein